MENVTNKTGVMVTAYILDGDTGYTIKQLDVSELQPGMYVREIGALLKVVGNTVESCEDYAIHTERGYYSPLCVE